MKRYLFTQKMKKNYVTGVISGLMASLIIVTGSITVISYIGSTTNTEVSETTSRTSITEYKVDALEQLIDKYYLNDIDTVAEENGMYKGLVESLNDPYSVYYTSEEYTALQESTSGTYCGIGATVSQAIDTGVITIVKPFSTGPAYTAGILPGDTIYKVSGQEVAGTDLAAVVSNMKGSADTEVILTIIRDGITDPFDVTINRKKIEVPTIEYSMLENNIGYISVSEFDEVTADQYKAALVDLNNQGMTGLVVDLRDNPGGLVTTVVSMLDEMLPKGIVVYTEDKYGKKTDYISSDDKQFTLPLAVLVNKNSASASEIFAGAIQDYGTGTIVGVTSYGKGIVQSIIPLTDGAAVKLTVANYYTPKGRSIHKIGITPDIEVKLSEELQKQVIIDKSEDNQLQAAIDAVKSVK